MDLYSFSDCSRSCGSKVAEILLAEENGKREREGARKVEKWRQVAVGDRTPNGRRRPENQLLSVAFSLSLPHGLTPAWPQTPLSASLTLMADGAAHCLRGHWGDPAHKGTPGTAAALHVSDLEKPGYVGLEMSWAPPPQPQLTHSSPALPILSPGQVTRMTCGP